MKRIKKVVLALCALAVMLVSLPPTQVFAATVVTTTYHQTDARNLAAKINEFRTGNDAWHWDKTNQIKIYCKNLQPLQYDAKLEKIAMLRAVELANDYRDRNFIKHHTSYGVYTDFMGEDVLVSHGGPFAIESILTAFNAPCLPYESSQARRNMLNANYNAIGVASSEINGETHWVIVYAKLKNITSPGNAINAKQNVTLPGYTNSPDRYTDIKCLNGTWQYIKNGAIDKTYTGLCKHNGSWYYVKNGEVDWTYTGLCNHNGTWYYIQKGVLNWNYTGLWKHNGTWYYVQKGVLNWNYTGLCKYNNNWYYVQKGVLNWNYTGLCKYNNAWWYVQNGKVNFSSNTVAQNQYGWWHVRNGKVDFTSNTVAQNQYGWWYIRNGKVDFTYTGLAKNSYGWWYIRNGKVDFNYSGTCKGPDGNTYKVKSGKVIF